ncbi:TetR/AcrR family transcriptional regulator [Promicromonospora sp. NPDC060271]|uniref:TetR/AcrR family transcriptional regulator n=1 Tax=Promicromonospora sp. NPDC060271 TaxID=3347089 RepID=UPI003661D0A4
MTTVDRPASTRRDARHNRELLVERARAGFAEHGATASLELIARSAGLAIGTLYRHFPRRIDLLVAVYGATLRDFLDAAEATLGSADPWDGFSAFFEELCAAQARDRGFGDFVSRRFPDDERTEALHDRLCQVAERALVGAQESGAVRRDVTTADLVMVLWAISGVAEATGPVAPGAWRRHLHVVLDGFRATAVNDLPGPPLDDEQLYRTMARSR